ncbi:hypothetical protein NPX13_g3833 [Xylaria arbuscula]|uniref:Uncharacterized protein n=1 Tax=Xylaria arbuscula TaxID=114810 RepID=A0A9W8TPQ4_9PEZI|nr:hypothetical protein NPX13_g3833 [Xylaria arbuscula]
MASLDRCLAEAQRCCFKNSSTVDILEYAGEEKSSWVKCKDLEAYLGTIQDRDGGRSSENNQSPQNHETLAHCHLRLFFISAVIDRNNELHAHVDPAILELLHQKSNLSAKFIIDVFQTEDWTVIPTSFHFSKLGEPPRKALLQYGFWSWGDRATHSFVQVVINPNVTTYYFINFKDDLKRFIETSLKDYQGSTVPPLFLDTSILTHVLNTYRQAIGTQRSILRQIEHHHGGAMVQTQVEELHSLSRTWHAMLKDFTDLKEHTKQLKAFLKRWKPTSYKNSRVTRRDRTSETIEAILQFETDSKFWASWATTYLERTNICINLAHHLENKEIATQARRESIAMFTLAIVTVIFLPSTFVAEWEGHWDKSQICFGRAEGEEADMK